MDVSWSVVVILITFGIVAGSAALWNKSRFSDNMRQRVKVNILPWLFLMEGLLENVERLQLDMESDSRAEFSSELLEILVAVKEAIPEPVDAEQGNGLKIAVQIIDAKLVPLLRAAFAKTSTGSILDMYLPKAGQTWQSFLQSKTKEEQELFDAEMTSKLFPHLELIESLLGCIEKLESDLNQDVIDLNRNTDDEEAVEALRYNIVKILYATDRKVTTNGEYIGTRSQRSASQPLHYGWVEIGIPATHKEGSLEAPRAIEEADPGRHFVVFSVNTSPRGDFDLFVKCIDEDRASVANDASDSELLVYIHGYNARHLDTIRRVAQLKCDFNFKGTVVLYSWSSKGSLLRYKSDEESVRKTEYSLQAFLRNIMCKVQASRVHILAHSMGTRALVGALILHLDGVHDGRHRLSCPLSQIILVAADEERGRFEDLVQKLNKRYESITSVGLPQNSEGTGGKSGVLDSRPHLSVYCSERDLPLAMSKYYHGAPRLGDIESIFKLTSDATLGGYDVIDSSFVRGGSRKHHSYHLESPTVIEDIRNLLVQRMPARDRSNLKPVQNKGREFFRL